MKKRSRNTFRFIIPILSALSMATDPVRASTFTFSFTNVANGSGTATVTGVAILNNTDTAATSLTVTSNTDGFGIGEYVGVPGINTFTVVSGQVVAARFQDFGQLNTPPAVTCCSIDLEFAGNNASGLENSNMTVHASSRAGLTFTPVVSAIPLPAALPLFATGLGALGLLGWRRKKKSAALAA